MTRGFGFVEYDLEEDAAAAIDNMDGSELYGRVIRCNIARTLPKLAHGKAIWSAEEWIQSALNEGENISGDGETVEPANLAPASE
jgi:peptidyl-prolyl isomerase E (cyclophilin E)